MAMFIFKTIVGLLMGVLLANWSGDAHMMFIPAMLWGLGIAFAFRSHLQWMGNALHWGMQLSIISFLSFGTGIFGFLLLILVLVFNLTLGWIYGIFLFIRDLVAICRGGM